MFDASEILIAFRWTVSAIALGALVIRRRHRAEAAGYFIVLSGMIVSLQMYDGSGLEGRVAAGWTAQLSMAVGAVWVVYTRLRFLRRRSGVRETPLADARSNYD